MQLMGQLMNLKMFRERNPLPLGMIVVVWLVATVLLVLNVNSVMRLWGAHYEAVLPEAAGLAAGDPVRVSGMHVGRVDSVELGGDGVMVEFTISETGIDLGEETTAEVSVDTVLGDKALQLTSEGEGQLAEGATIPIERTSAPYDITEALTDLHDETKSMDVDKVAGALDQVASTVQGATPELRRALHGVGRISATISDRDEALRHLLANTEAFTDILADRSGDMTALVEQGNLLFAALAARRDDISSLLTNLSSMARQLSGFVKDNQAQLGATLDGLNDVIDTLRENKQNISATLSGMSVYVTGLGEVVSSGEFFSAYLQNLLPGNLFQPDLPLESPLFNVGEVPQRERTGGHR